MGKGKKNRPSASNPKDHEVRPKVTNADEPKQQRSSEDYEKEIKELKNEISYLKKKNEELQQKQDVAPDRNYDRTKDEKERNMDVDELDWSDMGACSTEYETSSRSFNSHANQGKTDRFSEERTRNWKKDVDELDCSDMGACSTEYQTSSRSFNSHANQGKTDRFSEEPTRNWRNGNKRPEKASQPYQRHSSHSDFKQSSGKERSRHQQIHYAEKGDLLKFQEINGDLFEAPKEYSLAHCVAEDLKMGSGIAVSFRQNFKRLDDLYSQRKKVGQVAILDDNERFVYYLITKKISEGKPTMGDFEASLWEMKKHIMENKVKKLAIPRLGCGLDRLKWHEVRTLIWDIFRDVELNIMAYNFTVDQETSSTPLFSKSRMKIVDRKRTLDQMERDSFLILFGSPSGDVDDTMNNIHKRYPIIHDYKQNRKEIGDIIHLTKKNEHLCIFIVKDNNVLNYKSFFKCLLEFRKLFKELRYYYMAFEAFLDAGDDLTVIKLKNMFKAVFSNLDSELWICWPPELESLCPEQVLYNK